MESTKDMIKELLRAMRGLRSQQWLNQRLNYSYNIASRWESGRRKMTWDEFANFCGVLGFDLEEPLRILFKGQKIKPSQAFKRLAYGKEQQLLIKLLQCSKSKVYRLLSGEQSPYLESVLELINYQGDLVRFLSYFVEDVNDLPTLANKIAQVEKARRLFRREPMASPILLFFDCEQYFKLTTHSPQVIAKRFGLTLKKTKSICDQLLSLGLVVMEQQKMKPVSSFLNLGWSKQDDLKDLNKIEKFWIAQAGKSFSEDSIFERKTIGFQVYNANARVEAQMKEAIDQFYLRVHRILEDGQDEVQDSQFVLNYQVLKIRN